MRKVILSVWLFTLIAGSAVWAQNVGEVGRWAEGRCEAIYRRGSYTFLGNGAYLEVYHRPESGGYQRLDRILLSAPIQDIWVKGDMTHIYAACGDTGLQVVYFDAEGPEDKFVQVIGWRDTEGFASGVCENGGYTYVADGENGLVVFNTGFPSNPQRIATLPLNGAARDVWIVGGLRALVSADTAGLYMIDVSVPGEPEILDQYVIPSIFPTQDKPAAHAAITIGDSVAYLSAGWGGMHILDIRNPSNITAMASWPTTGTALDVRDTWITGDYAHLACGDKGFYTQIDISDIQNITGPQSKSNDTDGFATKIIVESDTAFTADSHNGHLILDVDINNVPSILESFPMADVCYGVTRSGDYAYAAAGRAGLKIFEIQTTYPEGEMIPLAAANTNGEVRSVTQTGAFAYVADGSRGVKLFDVTDVANPEQTGVYNQAQGDCYDVAAPAGSYLFGAFGDDGLRVLDYSDFNNIQSVYHFQTPGSARAVRVIEDLVFLADSSSVIVYSVAGLPGFITSMTETDSLTNTDLLMDARNMFVDGGAVFIANGSNGLAVWDRDEDTVQHLDVDGVCTDVYLYDKTLYVTIEGEGLRLYNYADDGALTPVGGYPTKGSALGLDVSESGERILVASGGAGLYDLSSTLRPQISVVPDDLNFGKVAAGYSRSLKLEISNPGTQDLMVDRIQLSEPTAAFTFSETRFTVPPGETHSVWVIYAPTKSGASAHGVSAYIYSNATPSSYPIWLSGVRSDPQDALPYEPDVFTRGLWHFDETTGSAVVDESGNGLGGQAYGTPVRVGSKPGFDRAIQFNGGNDRIVMGSDPLLNLSTTSFTLELWFYATDLPEAKGVLLKYGAGNNEQYELALNGGEEHNGLIGRVWDAAGFAHTVSGVPLSELGVDQWYHASLTWTGDSLKLFLNGVERGAVAVSGSLLNVATESLSVGSDVNGNHEFYGIIDEIRMSNIARQSWEFNVDRSRMEVDFDPIRFGRVIVGESRKRTLRIRSIGSDTLRVIGISTTHNRVTISADAGFQLPSGRDTTLWLTFHPEETMNLNGEAALVIASSDPTYPFVSIPIYGSGVHTLPAGAYSSDPFTLALYHFEEIQETTVFDSSGNAMDGELFHGILADAENGKFGQYLFFETVDQYCEVQPVENPDIGPVLGGFSAEAWIRMRQLPDLEGIILRRGNEEIHQFSLVVDTSAQVLLRLWDEQGEMASINSSGIDPLVLHQWYHVAFSYDRFSRMIRLFINGQEVSSALLPGLMAGTSGSHAVHATSLYLGGDPSGTRPFNGYMDEVRLSSTARQVWEFNVNLSRSNIYPTWIDFGKVLIGADQDETFWVSNPGLESLIVTDILIDSDYPEFFEITPTAFTISPGEVQPVTVVYAPQEVGTHTADIELQSNNLFPDQTVHLQGVCIDSSFTGPYEWDNRTIDLVHFEQGADTQLVTGGQVSWSDTARFGHSSMRLRGGWVNIPTDTSLDLSRDRFTIETWFSLAQMPATRWTLLYWGYGNQWIQFTVDPEANRGLQVRMSNSNSEILTLPGKPLSQLRTDYWYHFALAWSGDTLRLYINNTLYAESEFSGSLAIPSGQPIRMGGLYADQTFPFQGWVDEFRLSSKERHPWEYNVVSPLISLGTRRLDFAAVEAGRSRTLPVRITNLGDEDLVIHSMNVGHSVFSLEAVQLPLTVSRMEYVTAKVTFHPLVSDTTYQSTLNIASNDTTVTSSVIALSGRSVARRMNDEFQTDDPFTVALYHFNHDLTDTTLSDTVLTDPTGAGRNGRVYGATWIPDGLYGEALRFDGTNNWVEIPSVEEWVFDTETEAYTIEFSMRTDTVKTQQTLVFKGVRDTVQYGMYLGADGRMAVHGFGSGGPRLNDGLWHQIAFVYDPTALSRLYVDGELALSKAWVQTGPEDTGHPLMFGASLTNSGRTERFFQGVIDEFRLSDVARAEWEVAPSDYGIQVAVRNTSNLTVSDTLDLSVWPPPSLDIDSLYVHFRRGGGLHPYASVPAAAEGDSFFVRIPSDSVTLNGLEYYVDGITRSGVHYTAPSWAPVHNPYSVSVYHDTLADRLTHYAQEIEDPESGAIKIQKAALFSLPTQLSEITADSVLKDLFPYNPYQWRLFWWHSSRSPAKVDSGLSQVYLEYPPPRAYPEYFHMTPGRAFWIVSRNVRNFQLPEGHSVSTDEAFEIGLNPGWNMVGSPFWFPVAWEDCSVAGTSLIRTIYAWEGEDGYNSEIANLEPWVGYWVFNPDTVYAVLTIPPKEAARQPGNAAKKLALPAKHIAHGMQDSEWLIRLTAETDGSSDRFNYAGVRIRAENGLDPYDQAEPPKSLGRQIRMTFDPAAESGHSVLLTSDVRGPAEDGQVWRITLDGCKTDQPFRIRWAFIQILPQGWECYLIDLEEGNSVNCREAEGLGRSFQSNGSSGYQFKLVAGTPEFLDENREGISLEPIAFALHQNYPNPFNPETTIRYSLPGASRVEITIFNVLGRKVKTYQRNHAAAGHYQIVWDATNDHGVQVSSGVYFYRIRTEDRIANRKMVVIR